MSKTKKKSKSDQPGETVTKSSVGKSRSLKIPTIGCSIFFVITFFSLILLSFLLPEPKEDQHPFLASVSHTFHHIGERLFGPVFKYSLFALDWFRLPPDNAIISFGVDHNVIISYDNIGVPHIYAKTMKDMITAVGFVHARDRLFQMEINRLLSNGKLSEILGEAVLPIDRLFRVYGFHRYAKDDLASLNDTVRQHLQNYVDGINEYLDKFESQLPIEFTLLGFKPKHWNTIDILTFSRFIAWQLGHGDSIEFSRLSLSKILESELLIDLGIIVQDLINDTDVSLNFKSIKEILEGYINPGGSNSFAISGNLTYSGKPILASDPHLQLTSPSIWYQMHMVTESEEESFQSIGVTMPGFPMTLYGHNDKVSWGCVLSLIDVKDQYLEKFDWENKTYEYKGEQIKPKIFKEEIFIKGQSTPYIEEVYETIHGPVISRLSTSKSFVKDGKHIETTLNTISNKKKSTIAEGFYKLCFSKTIYDARDALKMIDIVTLGFTVADSDNNIAYFTTGDIPIKRKGFGLFPSEGWTGKNDWQGIIPFDEKPAIINPKEGFIVTSNNRMVDDDYPYYLGVSFFKNTRSTRLKQRINEAISSGKKIDVKTVTNIQFDVGDLIGLKFQEVFFKHFDEKKVNLTNNELLALNYFRQWNGSKDVNSIGATVSQAILLESIKTLILNRLPAHDAAMILGISDNFVFNLESFYHLVPNFIDLLEKESKWWDGNNSKSNVLFEGFKKGFQWLNFEFGSNINNWRWGQFHRVSWGHVLSKGNTFYFKQIFSVGYFECPGDIHTPNKAGYSISRENNRLDVTGPGVSYRQIIDHHDFENSFWVHGPGQSGRISSKNHDDQVDSWLNGRLFSMPWSKKHVLELESGHIELSNLQ